MFKFGRNVFLVAIGSQLTNASQAILVTRCLGLEMAAVWAVCTRMLMFASELVFRLSNFAEPVFAEMIVRGERDQLRRRFGNLLIIVGAVTAWGGFGFSLLNQPFVHLWTSGKVGWSPWLDLLLAFGLVVRTLVRCHVGLTIMTKDLGQLPLITLAEGVAFILLSLLLVPVGGIGAMIGLSIASTLVFSGQYVWRRTAWYLGVAPGQLLSNCLQYTGMYFVVCTAIVVPALLALGPWPPVWQLAVGCPLVLFAGGWLFVKIALDSEVHAEIVSRFQTPWPKIAGVVARIKT
jgi:O-antigen/teichoic acid export membrane protein